MPITFDDATRELLDGTNFATVATLNPDGEPQTSVVWILREGDTVMFSSTTNRQKVRNLTRDPRISLTVLDTTNPYRTVEIRGTAELVEDRDRAVQREVSHKYLGEDPPSDPEGTVRVIVRVIPHKVGGFSN
ncbi:PPOX class F420-dependent oxidoreductase [Nocardia sp. NBC_00881]|uniref:PPOX class F420-dependent oxidoreductase n=1 Tax=Nocardia sp. NBC_00881 TaxID=2975995 RepID=UPI00386EA821|nr:PPOX class F420-dependent oxidoreductase [Nocardia sp. NBC_00881]